MLATWLCRDDVEALDALDEAMKRGDGAPKENTNNKKQDEDLPNNGQTKSTVDIINSSTTHASRPTGTSRERSLRKLRTEAEKSPEVKKVYEKVKAGEISPQPRHRRAVGPPEHYAGTGVVSAWSAVQRGEVARAADRHNFGPLWPEVDGRTTE